MPTQPIVRDEPGRADAAIVIRGARVHNLRNVDLDVPRDRLVVLTGVSGSGKSSLAFDTVFAEGQRRYIECLSSYARQFLDQLERPDVDQIDGLPPTVAIDQRAGQSSPRSTVGTLTEINDYLRLLYSRLGVPHCPTCGLPIRSQTPEQMVATVMAFPVGRKLMVLAPLVRKRKGAHPEVFQAIRRAGLIRARVDGEVVEVADEPPKLTKTKNHDVDAVVDRLVIREGIGPRLAESIGMALKLSEGLVTIMADVDGRWEDRLLSIHHACPGCGTSLQALEPRAFSFNSPQGACPRCDGLGLISTFQPDLVVPDRAKTLEQGAVAPWTKLTPRVRELQAGSPMVVAFLDRHHLSRSDPLDAWPEAHFEAFLQGATDEGFPGVLAMLDQLYQAADRASLRTTLDAYREESSCPACEGTRLRPEARAARIAGKSIDQVSDLAIDDAKAFFEGLCFGEGDQPVAAPLVREIQARLRFLADVGLGYLSLGRGSQTLSGGELQRVRLATQLGSDLVGVCYVLDEPTAGLHPRDTARLLAGLRELESQGNSVIIVEHDEAVIRAADWVIDVGPGAGPDGGSIVDVGTPEHIARSTVSITGRYLRGEAWTSRPRSTRLERTPGWITVTGASVHNLKQVEARIPRGALTCVTGVSGSGKSTLVHDVLARGFRRRDRPSARELPGLGRIVGWEPLTSLIEVDQSPIGRNPRSTPATFTGVFDQIRRVFTTTREARMRGYGAARFSFNAKGGRCEVCEGQGRRRIPMQFLPDLFIVCEECQGKRFNRQTLEILFKDKSIGDVLDLRVDEARAFFESQPRVLVGLNAMHDVGLGYLTLGQSSTTLSGGEAQRVKLAAQLGRTTGGDKLYILDEPTTGLHFADIDRLLAILHRLADLGDTLIVIEHNLDVIATADWVVDLGPEAGVQGGRIVAMGTPEEVASTPESLTGAYLKDRLA